MTCGFATREALDAATLRRAPVRSPRPSRWGASSGFIGKRAQAAAAHLGIDLVGGLLEHLPVEGGTIGSVANLVAGERSTVVVEVRRIRSRPVRRRAMKPLVEAHVGDLSGTLRVAFFNQPWLVERYPVGTRLILEGTLKGPGRFSVTAHAPTGDPLSGGGAQGRIPAGAQDPSTVAAGEAGRGPAGPSAPTTTARYPATEGLSSLEIFSRVRAHRDAIADTVDPLPARLRRAERLPGREDAVHAAHFGDREAGRRRLAFDELLLSQLELLRRRRVHGHGRPAIALRGAPQTTERWIGEVLPFALTGDQRRAIDANAAVLGASVPLGRLLMGEVGSGKTVVALHAMLRAVECGHQAALMAPTETLAQQHLRTVQALLPDALVPVGLLTGSTPAARRRETLERLASGALPLVVGTHALIEEPVAFRSLAVAVVDEQHRFGVRQRAALDDKAPPGHAPHVLHMTATPIPRTTALLHHGDLDVVALRELPRGRRPVRTHVCTSERERERAYARIREEVASGRQAFLVCPLVEDSETLDARSATAEFERLRHGELRDLRLALLHGQMRPVDKQRAMEGFAAGGADVLVATTVIEVGIDVPNATVMVVENAERFGISQLHQLRGRVGRGEDAAVCLLFGPKRAARLEALARHADGFALSEIDLELRGEGELLGTRQSGLAQFRLARLPDDAELLFRAREVAEDLAASDPELADPVNALLRDALHERHGARPAPTIPA